MNQLKLIAKRALYRTEWQECEWCGGEGSKTAHNEDYGAMDFPCGHCEGTGSGEGRLVPRFWREKESD